MNTIPLSDTFTVTPTTGRHSATNAIEHGLNEHTAKMRAFYAYPIQLEGRHHQPGARLALTEAAREWRARQIAAAGAATLAQATS